MITVRYPSKKFSEIIEGLCNERANFEIRISDNTPQKRILLRKLPLILGQKSRQLSPIVEIWQTLRISRFFLASSSAVGKGYRMDYEDEGDLIVRFRLTDPAEVHRLRPVSTG